MCIFFLTDDDVHLEESVAIDESLLGAVGGEQILLNFAHLSVLTNSLSDNSVNEVCISTLICIHIVRIIQLFQVGTVFENCEPQEIKNMKFGLFCILIKLLFEK